MRGDVQEGLPADTMEEDGTQTTLERPDTKVYYMVHPSVDVDGEAGP